MIQITKARRIFGLPSIEGALVNSVERNGPADKSGIEPSDVIIEFDGKNKKRKRFA